MLTVIVGLAGAFIYGSADFLGGLASRRISSIRVTAIAAVAGLIVLLLALPLIGGAWSYEAVLFGALSGVAGAGAIVLLYACLAIGPMSILSPLTALVSAVVPMTVGLARGEQLGMLGYIALGVALIAVVLVGFVPEKDAVRPTLRALTMAVGSGALIGVFMILIDATPDDSGLVPLVANRAANGVLMWVMIGVLAMLAMQKPGGASAPLQARSALGPHSRSAPVSSSSALPNPPSAAATDGAFDPPDMIATAHSPHPWLSGLRLALLCGVLDAAANAVMLLGLRLGELSVMSVLTAMYPAGTIVLAAVVLREKLTPLQIVGLVLALAAAGMLALA